MLELRLRACSSIPALKSFPFFAFSMNRFGGSHPLRDLARGLRYAQAGLGSGPTTPSLGPGPAAAVIDPPAQHQTASAANAGDGQPAAVPDPAPAVAASNMATQDPVSTATPAPVPAAAPADPPGGYLATSKAASPPVIQTKAVPKHPPTTGGLPPNPPAAAVIPPASADTRPAASGQQASGSGQPASGSEPRVDDDDLVYAGLADLPLSQASRLLVLLSEVCQDNFYALANLGQYDVEAPIFVLAAQSTRPGSVPGQYRPVGARSMPEGPRLPDREGAAAIEENLFDPDAPLTPRRINTGPWNKSEGWMRLSICLPDSPGLTTMGADPAAPVRPDAPPDPRVILCTCVAHGTVLCSDLFASDGTEAGAQALLASFGLAWTSSLPSVMCPDTPARDALVMGSVLCLIWSSLRWNDGLWSPPGRLVLQYDSSAVTGLATRTKSCRASMPWGCQLFGLTGGPSACWGLSWLNLVNRALADTRLRFPGRSVDFLLPLLAPDTESLVMVSPLHRSRAMPWLRALLDEHWREHSSGPPPPEHARFGVHSCKATVLSWARQCHLSPELRRLQGHHRPSAMEGSVRVYSRDDVGPMLLLQAEVINRIRPSAAAPVDDVPELSADSSDSDVSTASASEVDTSVEVLLVRVPATNHMAADYPAASYSASSQQAPAPDVWHTFRAARGHDGAVLLPSVPELVDLEELSDEDLLAMLRRCSAGFLARLARLIGRILRPVPQVVTCHLPCVNPECNQVCGRVIDVTRRRQHRNHACRVCHSFGW
ncbi:unnamed protein product [Symbiodinium sp. CCMP2592]|nr:unnamed protein product [Symbiodinium sp. CCMP2592]